MTEYVRLTDDDALQSQTGEGEDIFEWLKHRAAAGALDAQVRGDTSLERMMLHAS
jgi:hypothetical protein